MPLDQQAKAFLYRISAQRLSSFNTLPLDVARKAYDRLMELPGLKPETVAKVENRLVSYPSNSSQIPVRIYTPAGSEPFPVLVFFHGGGFVLGSIDTYDELCRALTNGAGCIVVSVGYRIAPEYKFPAAVEDCYAATMWVAKNAKAIGGDPTYIAVGGDSAGGNLAAVVALMARDKGTPPLIFQLLVYPLTDFALDSPLCQETADGYLITKNDRLWFRSLYLRSNADCDNPYASPLRARSLSGLPPTMVITAEFDPLRDEGEAYATRLRETGVAVVCTRYNGMIHGFLSLPFEQGRKARREVVAALRSVFTT